MDARNKLERNISELESQIGWMEDDLEDARQELKLKQEELYKLDN